MLEKLTGMIREQTGNASLTLTRDTVLLTDLGMNSLDLVELVCVLEDEMGVEIPDRMIGEMKTVGDVIDFIESQG